MLLPKLNTRLTCCKFRKTKKASIELSKQKPPAGLEPAIPGLGGRCLIHWATEAYESTFYNRAEIYL